MQGGVEITSQNSKISSIQKHKTDTEEEISRRMKKYPIYVAGVSVATIW